jgi:hypothetical protein
MGHVFDSSAMYVQHIHSFFQSRLGTADYALLVRGQVCHLSVSVCNNLSGFMGHVFDSSAMYVQHIHSFFQSRPGTADYALLVTSSSHYHGSL